MALVVPCIPFYESIPFWESILVLESILFWERIPFWESIPFLESILFWENVLFCDAKWKDRVKTSAKTAWIFIYSKYVVSSYSKGK